MKKYLWVMLVLAIAVPALAQAPKALQIYLNQRPYQGKAIWYKDEIYVPLSDVVRNMGGSFAYNHTTGVVNVSIGAPAPPPPGYGPQGGTGEERRPLVKAEWEQQTLYGNNSKVTAIFQNSGNAPAINVEALCVFQDGMRTAIGTSVKHLGNLMPGESRVAEFWLFDPAYTSTYGYGYSAFGGSALNLSQSPFSTIVVGPYQTEVQYEFKVLYR